MRIGLISAVKYLFQALHNGLPGVLASVIGALVMSYLHWGSGGPPPAAHGNLSADQRLQIAQMVKEEHTLLIEFLKKQQAAQEAQESASARASAPLPKVADSESALPAEHEMPRPVAKPKSVVTHKPLPPVETPVVVESGPLVAPEDAAGEPIDIGAPPRPGLARRVIDATHVRDAASFVLDLPGRLGRTMSQITVIRGEPTVHFVRASW